MPILHFSRRLRACVLSWLLMAMAVAMAAPLLHDGPLDLVCSGSGQMKLVQLGDDPDLDSPATLDCPNCLLLGPLPDCATSSCSDANAHTTLRLSEQRAHPARFDTVPPPARGPPEYSTQTR
jgi:hypothetical protein